MKPKKMSKKLILNKNTIANINDDKMHGVLAGNLVPNSWGELSCETGCHTLVYRQKCPPQLVWVCGDTNPTVG